MKAANYKKILLAFVKWHSVKDFLEKYQLRNVKVFIDKSKAYSSALEVLADRRDDLDRLLLKIPEMPKNRTTEKILNLAEQNVEGVRLSEINSPRNNDSVYERWMLRFLRENHHLLEKDKKIKIKTVPYFYDTTTPYPKKDGDILRGNTKGELAKHLGHSVKNMETRAKKLFDSKGIKALRYSKNLIGMSKYWANERDKQAYFKKSTRGRKIKAK